MPTLRLDLKRPSKGFVLTSSFFLGGIFQAFIFKTRKSIDCEFKSTRELSRLGRYKFEIYNYSMVSR
jgi:hypothetical protein